MKRFFQVQFFKPLFFLLPLLIIAGSRRAAAQGSCYATQGCSNYANFGFNSSGAKDLEYDNYVSGFHQSAVRDIDGTFKVWGEYSGATGLIADSRLVPTPVNPGNYPGLTGVPLKIAISDYNNSAAQYILLTSDGKLWSWGGTQYSYLPITTKLILTDQVNLGKFQQLTIGLPAGVAATDVKMMFAANDYLAITTCPGDVYVLAKDQFDNPGAGSQKNLRGDGNTGSATAWSHVQKSTGGYLTGVVATRGSGNALVALDASGNLWTWGPWAALGNGGSHGAISKATQMILPGGTGAIKMIGATLNAVQAYGTTYYVLYENGSLYAMGGNAYGQIGDWTTTNRFTWVPTRYNSAAGPAMQDIKWMSPDEHSAFGGKISVITAAQQIFDWGGESGYCLGRGLQASASATPVIANPGVPTQFETGYNNSGILAIETGGHTVMLLKQCVNNFGYVGHRIDGSMGDNSALDNTDNIFHFHTNAVQVCGAPTVTATLVPSVVGPYCIGNSITMLGSPAGGTYSIDVANSTATATINAATGALSFTTAGTLRVNYTVNDPGGCGTVTIGKLLNVGDCGAKITIPGKVWIDNNKNAIIDGTETGTGNGFWANLTDPNGNVIASVKVNTDGTYSFVLPTSALTASGNYTVILTNTSKNVGDKLTNADIPGNGYNYTGVNRGGTTGVSTANRTGTLNIGNLSTVAGGTTTNPVNFGITQLALPVLFGNITASIKGNTLFVNWQSLTEENNDHFEIEASADGKTFTKIGAVKSKANGGNSTMALDYNFSTDKYAGSLVISSSILGFLALGLGFIRRKLKVAFVLAVISGGLFFAGCTKNNPDMQNGNAAKLYIRVAQVDIDGVKSYSKVITAVHE